MPSAERGAASAPSERAELEAFGGWRAVLARVFRGEDLSFEEAACVHESILTGEALPTQVAAFIGAMRTKGETALEIAGLVSAMVAHCVPLDLGPGLLDTCGTGGDGSGSINVSTMAAVVAAAAGARVCKHGARASSSVSGSADVFEALGVVADLGPEGVAKCVSEVGVGFCFAPRFHPAMRHAAPVRRELGVGTIFNFLGPLANPSRPTRQILGVGDASMAERMLAVLEHNGTEHAMVVFGHDGLDELSTAAPSTVLETTRTADGSYSRSRYDVDATTYGLARCSPGEVRGGTPAENAEHARAVFAGQSGPKRDIVLINSSAALVVAGLCADLGAGVELAASVVDEGRAASTLEGLVTVSRQAAAAEISEKLG